MNRYNKINKIQTLTAIESQSATFVGDFMEAESVVQVLNFTVHPRERTLLTKRINSPEWNDVAVRKDIFEKLICLQLRTFVEEWIHTGRRPDGSEAPFSRNLSRARRANIAARAFLKKRPALEFNEDLTPALRLTTPTREAPEASEAVPKAVRKWAGFLLCSILMSRWKHALFRCTECDAYRLVSNHRPKKQYPYGMFCRNHLQVRGSVRRKRELRERAKATLIEKSAKAINQRGWTSNWRASRMQKQILVADLTRAGLYMSPRRIEYLADLIEARRAELAKSTF